MRSRTLYTGTVCIAFPATLVVFSALFFYAALSQITLDFSYLGVHGSAQRFSSYTIVIAVAALAAAVISLAVLLILKKHDAENVVFDVNNRSSVALGILESIGAASCLFMGIAFVVIYVGQTFYWMVHII